jgi:hypothetical protein
MNGTLNNHRTEELGNGVLPFSAHFTKLKSSRFLKYTPWPNAKVVPRITSKHLQSTRNTSSNRTILSYRDRSIVLITQQSLEPVWVVFCQWVLVTSLTRIPQPFSDKIAEKQMHMDKSLWNQGTIYNRFHQATIHAISRLYHEHIFTR